MLVKPARNKSWPKLQHLIGALDALGNGFDSQTQRDTTWDSRRFHRQALVSRPDPMMLFTCPNPARRA